MPKRISSSLISPIDGRKSGDFSLVPTDVPSDIPPDWLLGYIRSAGGNKPSSEPISLPLYLTATNTTKWAYMTVNGEKMNAENLEEQLNQLGKDRWEFCSIVNRPNGEIWIFKRPLNN